MKNVDRLILIRWLKVVVEETHYLYVNLGIIKVIRKHVGEH